MAKFKSGQQIHRRNLPSKIGKIVAGPMQKYVYPTPFNSHKEMAYVGQKRFYSIDFGRHICINCDARDYVSAQP